MQVLGPNILRLTPRNRFFIGGGQNIGKGGAIVTPAKELVITFVGCYLCATFGGNRSRNATVRVGVSPISPIWHLNCCQMITVNFGVSGPKFAKFLRDVETTSMVLRVHPLSSSVIRCGLRLPRRRVADFGRFGA